MNVTTFANSHASRVSLSEAIGILNRHGNAYSDEEVKKIVDYLYALAELEVEYAENQNRKNADRCKQK